MLKPYNRFAGTSVHRLEGLSDGVFAIAMTLLVLELHAPTAAAIHAEAELGHVLMEMWPHFLVYFMSFLTLGIFWVGQQTQLNFLARADRDLSWLHLLFLCTISLLPFTTALMGQFIAYRLALLIYWGNILLCGVMLFLTWRHAMKAGLAKADTPETVHEGMLRRIVVSQALYAVGAALCVVNTYVSLGFIFLMQLNYAFAPKVKWLFKI